MFRSSSLKSKSQATQHTCQRISVHVVIVAILFTGIIRNVPTTLFFSCLQQCPPAKSNELVCLSVNNTSKNRTTKAKIMNKRKSFTTYRPIKYCFERKNITSVTACCTRFYNKSDKRAITHPLYPSYCTIRYSTFLVEL